MIYAGILISSQMSPKDTHRIEKDEFGTFRVPKEYYWGAQTQRTLDTFQIGSSEHERVPLELIHALALIKKAAAIVNVDYGLSQTLSDMISRVADEVIEGRLDVHFPLGIWQTGSGTQTNVNVNEVIANRGNELLDSTLGWKKPIHPNDHVNKGQSSNDTFPTAMHVSVALQLKKKLIPSLRSLQEKLESFAQEFSKDIKIGRTHLQDALPMTIGQEFSAWATQVKYGIERIEATFPHLHFIAQGGTAIGTGMNSFADFDVKMARQLNLFTGIPFQPAPDKFEALSSNDTMLEVSGVVNTIAASMMKIANDIRLLGSGPRCGLRELFLPDNEPGSPLMPGKVNPTQCEIMTMICCQVMGNHVAVTVAASNGHFQLNAFKPVIISNVLRSIQLLSDASSSFLTHCISGIRINSEQTKLNVTLSLTTVASLNPYIGYENVAKIAKKAHEDNITLQEAGTALGLLTQEQFEQWLTPADILGPKAA